MTVNSEYCQYIGTPAGLLKIIANNQAILAVDFIAATDKAEQPNNVTNQAATQLTEYIAGQRQQFDLPLAAQGTEFQRRVWQLLSEIPYGNTCSYKDIASLLDNPYAVRAVGAANGRNPIAIIVPCHRVIGADGSLTGYAGGLERKSWLLTLEKSVLSNRANTI